MSLLGNLRQLINTLILLRCTTRSFVLCVSHSNPSYCSILFFIFYRFFFSIFILFLCAPVSLIEEREFNAQSKIDCKSTYSCNFKWLNRNFIVDIMINNYHYDRSMFLFLQLKCNYCKASVFTVKAAICLGVCVVNQSICIIHFNQTVRAKKLKRISITILLFIIGLAWLMRRDDKKSRSYPILVSSQIKYTYYCCSFDLRRRKKKKKTRYEARDLHLLEFAKRPNG